MIEQVGQVIAILAGLIDRVVLAGVLLRIWGISKFETWSVILAVSGLVSLAEFGFSLYFNNRLMQETEQGRLKDSQRTFRIANTIFGVVAVFGFVSLALGILCLPVEGIVGDPVAAWSVLILGACTSLRIGFSASLSLYRANRQYGRLVLILSLGEILRVMAAIVVCSLGGGLLEVSIAAGLAAVIPQVVYPVLEARRRFLPHRWGFAIPSSVELRQALSISSAFFAQSVPIILLGTVPVLLLGKAGTEVGMLASFVLVRTLSGLPRTILQQFGIVLGQECGRRLAIGDCAGTMWIVAESARLYSIVSGLATGFLIVSGQEVVLLWTGTQGHFRLDYLICAALPMALTANSVLAHNILIATNAPFSAAAGRWTQFALTVVLIVLSPSQDLGLSLFIALSMGEILGFAPLAYLGVSRLVRGAGMRFHLKELVPSILSVPIGMGVSFGVSAITNPLTSVGRCSTIAIALILNGFIAIYFGLRPHFRRALLHQFMQPQLARLRFGVRGIRGLL